jgi:chemotaxis signal transduction protein
MLMGDAYYRKLIVVTIDARQTGLVVDKVSEILAISGTRYRHLRKAQLFLRP